MVAVSSGASTDKVIISDNVVPANGSFWIGLQPEIIQGLIKQPIIGFVETADDKSVGTHIGQTQITFNFQNCHKAKDGTGGEWEKMLYAISSWADNDNNNLLYLSMPDASAYNIAKWPDSTHATMAQIRGKIVGLPQILWSDANSFIFNIQFVRLTL